jgi:amino-acid N-acetyltransferase
MNAQLVNSDSLDELTIFLKANNLPYQDIQPGDHLFVVYKGEDGKLVGSGGLEFYGDYSLLRSIAVAENNRGRSLGKEIVRDLVDRARKRSVKKIYLLTETAPQFFDHLGFNTITRDQVPSEVKASSEFSTVCPASAICMVFSIDAAG